jgi:serine/threonine-protein kinase
MGDRTVNLSGEKIAAALKAQGIISANGEPDYVALGVMAKKKWAEEHPEEADNRAKSGVVAFDKKALMRAQDGKSTFISRAEYIARALGCTIADIEMDPIEEFKTFIQDEIKGFVGRKFIFKAIEEFIKKNNKGYCFIVGPPGAGKSAIAAKYVNDNSTIGYFNIQSEEKNTPDAFLKSLNTQLEHSLKSIQKKAVPDKPSGYATFIRERLEAATQHTKENPLIIVIDALDEVNMMGAPATNNLLYLPQNLPARVFFIITTRPGQWKDKVMSPDAPRETIDLEVMAKDTDKDIGAYIQSVVNDAKGRVKTEISWLDKEGVNAHLTNRIQQNFMYARHLMFDIKNGIFKEEDINTENIPKGLDQYYERHWVRMGMKKDPLPHLNLMIIYLLAFTPDPITVGFIHRRFAGGVSAMYVGQVIAEWREFLRTGTSTDGKVTYKIYHSSFLSFLKRKDIMAATEIDVTNLQNKLSIVPGSLYP